jgi:hypothetical protein
MYKKNAIVAARLFSALALLLLLIALINYFIILFTSPLSLLHVISSYALGSFGYMFIGPVGIFVIILITLFLLFTIYATIFDRVKRFSSSAMYRSFLIGCLLIVLGVWILGIFATGAGVLLVLVWFVLVL